jgi:hypothetical protein
MNLSQELQTANLFTLLGCVIPHRFAAFRESPVPITTLYGLGDNDARATARDYTG